MYGSKQLGSVIRLSGVAAGLMVLTGCSYMYEVVFAVLVPPGVTSQVVLQVMTVNGEEGRSLVAVPAGASGVQGKVGVCCAPDPTVHLQAFADANSNGIHDVGEAMTVDPAGAFVLSQHHAVALSIPAPSFPTPSVSP